ncbi:uncharacterized protein LOC108462697 [Gossypium arboreum]|uniref:uncharacterized protein LOC108462697 n=1 Tax=Gossypium arboreum TaxID=29729 RepID=UPI0022F1B7CE|nr:uncharacterized protein LOC108462697 [Gossypium arboreum]
MHLYGLQVRRNALLRACALKCLISILFLHHRFLIRCLRRPSRSPLCPLPFSYLKKADGQSFIAASACKKGKNRERTSKTIALANKILIPGIAARKFPAGDVIYSDGRKSKLAIVFDASGVDASKLAVPEGSLVCLSFRANSQAMVDSWSKPFYDAFSESKSVQLYEIRSCRNRRSD